ncbi:MAG: TfoX/Sxy family protein [Helicobacteraceae bacterium]|jgi:TfoX/Sxy family transcriptional regulator of competence genes|nr:TfoX/Sxy family protein [Helicobacteraceae bacterium]
MASDLSFAEFVTDQIKEAGVITHKKTFGEYLIYANGKPAILICDNTAYVKTLECLAPYLANAEKAAPYKGAKAHYIVDPENSETLSKIVREIERVTPPPKPKKIKKI